MAQETTQPAYKKLTRQALGKILGSKTLWAGVWATALATIPQEADWKTSSWIWTTLIGLAASLIPIQKLQKHIEMPCVSAALVATTLALWQTITEPIQDPNLLWIPVIWATWALICRTGNNGLEKNLSGLLWIAGLVGTLLVEPSPTSLLLMTTCGVALIAGGGINRTAIAASCLLVVLTPGSRSISAHKNIRGSAMLETATCLLVSPGIIPKIVAILPTLDIIKPIWTRQESSRLGMTPWEKEYNRKKLGPTQPDFKTSGFKKSYVGGVLCILGMWGLVLAFGTVNTLKWLTERIEKHTGKPSPWKNKIEIKTTPTKIEKGTQHPKEKRGKWTIMLASVVLILLLATIAKGWGPTKTQVLETVQRDISMSGRTAIWETMTPLILERPWGGWSNGFWLGPYRRAATLEYLWQGGISEAHNVIMNWTIRAGIPIAVILTAALLIGLYHKNNTLKEKLILTVSALHYLGLSTSTFPLASTAAASARDNQKKRKWSPRWHTGPKSKTIWIGLLLGVTLWAIGAWMLLPKSTSLPEEFWVGQSVTPTALTGVNWFELSKELVAYGQNLLRSSKAKTSMPTATIDRNLYGNVIRVQAHTENEIDLLAQELQAQGHVFTRALKQTREETKEPTARAIGIALLPAGLLGIFALILAGNQDNKQWRPRTLTTIGLALCAFLVETPTKPKEKPTTVELGNTHLDAVFPGSFVQIDKAHTQTTLISESIKLDPSTGAITCPLGWKLIRKEQVSFQPYIPTDQIKDIPDLEGLLINYEPIRRKIEEMPTGIPNRQTNPND